MIGRANRVCEFNGVTPTQEMSNEHRKHGASPREETAQGHVVKKAEPSASDPKLIDQLVGLARIQSLSIDEKIELLAENRPNESWNPPLTAKSPTTSAMKNTNAPKGKTEQF